MRGPDRQDEQLEEFVAARTQDLHHDAYQLTADQQAAEHLVARVLADMRRERVDMAQAGAEARLRMARSAARDNTPTEVTEVSQLPDEFRVLAELSPRQRAVLLIQVVDNLDERETARALHTTTRTVTDTLHTVPYDDLPGATPHSGELRSLLEDFGELASTPAATTTLADIRDVPPPPRRPWWTYVAAFLVIALTVTTIVVTQRWHKDWLRSPEGLNHTHGTHFPAYTQGYKLVEIRDQSPGAAETLDLGPRDAVLIGCDPGQPDRTTVGRLFSGVVGNSPALCSTPGGAQVLTPAMGQTVLAIDDFRRKTWPVAIYHGLTWDGYPVATKDFDVEHDKTLTGLRPTDDSGDAIRPLIAGKVLTLHGSGAHHNGTFTGRLAVPAIRTNTAPVFSALLSPTTTGQFGLTVGHSSPETNCGSQGQQFYYLQRQENRTCSLMDRRVPQVEYNSSAEFQYSGTTVTVKFTVKHARGPWTLQLVYDVYRINNAGQLTSP